MNYYAKIIADAISPAGDRLTTMEVQFPRFVLAEFNTHRVFSRNSASSRAIPWTKQMERMETLGFAEPFVYPVERKGMSGGEPLTGRKLEGVRNVWKAAARNAMAAARAIGTGNEPVHKSVVNRLIEPFLWHKVIVTSTYWDNFFDQRDHEDADPSIRELARLMREAFDLSDPIPLQDGEWHRPYIESADVKAAIEQYPATFSLVLRRVSAARCARVSYLTHDGKRDLAADLALYDKLVERAGSDAPIHWSPLEHVATPWAANVGTDYLSWGDDQEFQVTNMHQPIAGNLVGWRSMRTEEEARRGLETMR